MNPGRELPGCIKEQPHSAGSLLKHCRNHGRLVKQEPLGKDSHCDESVTADWVHTHDWRACSHLQQLRGHVIRSPLGNACLARALGLALSYGALSRTRKVLECNDVVKKMVKTAKESKIKFTLGTDSWKNKGRERRHHHLSACLVD